LSRKSRAITFGFGRFGVNVFSDEETIDLFVRTYRSFISELKEGQAAGEIFIEKSGDLSFKTVRGLLPLDIERDGSLVTVASTGLKGDFDLTTFSGEVKVAANLSVSLMENFFRVYFSYYLLLNEALLLHSAGMELGGKGFLFVGQSGAGKSTISRLLRNYGEIYSDDLVAVDLSKEDTQILSTPFRGEETIWVGRQTGTRLVRVFFLIKSDKNEIVPVERGYAVAKLFANSPFVNSDDEMVDLLVERINSLLERVEFYILRFRKDGSVKEVLL